MNDVEKSDVFVAWFIGCLCGVLIFIGVMVGFQYDVVPISLLDMIGEDKCAETGQGFDFYKRGVINGQPTVTFHCVSEDDNVYGPIRIER